MNSHWKCRLAFLDPAILHSISFRTIAGQDQGQHSLRFGQQKLPAARYSTIQRSIEKGATEIHNSSEVLTSLERPAHGSRMVLVAGHQNDVAEGILCECVCIYIYNMYYTCIYMHCTVCIYIYINIHTWNQEAVYHLAFKTSNRAFLLNICKYRWILPDATLHPFSHQCWYSVPFPSAPTSTEVLLPLAMNSVGSLMALVARMWGSLVHLASALGF